MNFHIQALRKRKHNLENASGKRTSQIPYDLLVGFHQQVCDYGTLDGQSLYRRRHYVIELESHRFQVIYIIPRHVMYKLLGFTELHKRNVESRPLGKMLGDF